MTTACIFDIDGTLIESEDLDERFFVQAVTDVLGSVFFEDSWSNYTKVTDVGIIREILEKNRLPVSEDTVAAIRERFGVLVRDYLDRGGTCRAKPGAPDLLKELASRSGCSVGIATGGWKKTAEMKCAAAGIDMSGIPLTTSDDSDDRTEIMQLCLERMNGPFLKIVYIGDGVWDRDACGKLGWKFVGIGDKLQGKCDLWFEDFRQRDALLKSLC